LSSSFREAIAANDRGFPLETAAAEVEDTNDGSEEEEAAGTGDADEVVASRNDVSTS
jgi:hypothetical protein